MDNDSRDNNKKNNNKNNNKNNDNNKNNNNIRKILWKSKSSFNPYLRHSFKLPTGKWKRKEEDDEEKNGSDSNDYYRLDNDREKHIKKTKKYLSELIKERINKKSKKQNNNNKTKPEIVGDVKLLYFSESLLALNSRLARSLDVVGVDEWMVQMEKVITINFFLLFLIYYYYFFYCYYYYVFLIIHYYLFHFCFPSFFEQFLKFIFNSILALKQ